MEVYIFNEMFVKRAGTVRAPLSRFASWCFIKQIHMFLGNVLVSYNPSVYEPVATNLPRFDLSLTHLSNVILG